MIHGYSTIGGSGSIVKLGIENFNFNYEEMLKNVEGVDLLDETGIKDMEDQYGAVVSQVLHDKIHDLILKGDIFHEDQLIEDYRPMFSELM